MKSIHYKITVFIIILVLAVSCGLPLQPEAILDPPGLLTEGINRYSLRIPENPNGSSSLSNGLIIQYRFFVNDSSQSNFETITSAISNARSGADAFMLARTTYNYQTLVHRSTSDIVTIDFQDYPSFFTDNLLTMGLEFNSTRGNIELQYDLTRTTPILTFSITATDLSNPIVLNLRRNTGSEMKDFALTNPVNYINQVDIDLNYIGSADQPLNTSQNIRLSLIVYLFRSRTNFNSTNGDVYSTPYILPWNDLIRLDNNGTS